MIMVTKMMMTVMVGRESASVVETVVAYYSKGILLLYGSDFLLRVCTGAND